LVARSNKITVSNISLTGRNIGAQTVLVQFNLTWQNSWRTSAAPFNWDAAWVFVKYKVGNGDWKHATLSSTGHTIPSGANSTQNDGTGMFIYRSVDGTGTFSLSGIQLLWNYGSDGVANESKITVRVYAVEMVYNQVGGFQAGSGAINNGEFRRANDITSSGTASTFTITGTTPTVQGNSSSASPTNIAAYNNTANDLTGTSTASLASGYPTGFNAFYAMKYEISQQQYVEFLNTLTYTQQAARTASSPNSAAGTPALIAGNANRNGIDIQAPGTSATVPAVYACNLNGTNTYNQSDDGQHIACNYLSWDDLIAYLDWAALRPMTELEYEKSCRGNQNPVVSEFAWGNTSATALTGLSNASTMSETASNTSSNIAYNNSFPSGPVRTGIFATTSSTRATSGAGYYGNMELSGNLWERVVTLGNATGRNFSGTHGNGTLTAGGAANVSGWPTAAGAGLKGGGFESNNLNASISGRASAASGDNSRQSDFGGRGARSSSTGIVTDGLVLWLDAGIPSSYPTAGTTWTDLSGNNNNGTLTNGPTFNSANGGSIVFDGVNDYTDLGSNFTYPIFTISLWVNAGSTQVQYADIIDNNHTGFRNFVLQQNNNNTNQYAFGVSDASGGISSSGSINLTANTWTNISITFTPSDRVIAYVNGTFHSQGALANNRNILYQSQVLRLATWSAGGRNWNGRIASFISYNRVLSSAEILQNFNAQKALFGL